MFARLSTIKAQKPLGGLLIAFCVLIFGGAGCTSVEEAESNIATATSVVQENVSALQAAMERAQATYEKIKAIYDILNPEPTTSDAQRTTSDTSTPSVLPSEDPPQPVTEENTSSQ